MVSGEWIGQDNSQVVGCLFKNKNLFKYKKVLGVLVNRYNCTVNDSHYHYLAKYRDGLSLFKTLPN
ncbi:hypothetical protein CYY_008057, partial [Polysphondylium violaceum]